MLKQEDIDTFYAFVNSKNIKKLNSEIVKATGYKKSTVSTYLNRVKEPSEDFILAVYNMFEESSNYVPHENSIDLKPLSNFERIVTNLLEQQNVILQKQNSILEGQNAEVLEKLKEAKNEMASKTDVYELKKDISLQIIEINSQMNAGVSSVLQELKSLKSAGQKELVPSGKSKKH